MVVRYDTLARAVTAPVNLIGRMNTGDSGLVAG